MSPSVVGPSAIGRSVARVDGVAKVTGGARYAADAEVDGVTHAVMAMSTVARGRIAAIDTTAASGVPGVIGVFTHENMPRLNPFDDTVGYLKSFMPLQDDGIRHAGQPVAVAVADTLERAQHAAELVQVRYETQPPRVVLAVDMAEGYVPPPGINGDNLYLRGDPDAAFAGAEVWVEVTGTTPMQEHNAMEPSAVVAQWDGDRLTVHDSTQGIAIDQEALRQAFGLPAAENVRVLTPYLGGGFGGKGFAWPHTILTAAVAREVGRPVKLVLTRGDTYTSHGHRPETHQQLRIGATRDGRLTAIDHVITEQVSRTEEHMFSSAAPTRMLYACPNVRTTQRAVPLDLPVGNFTRSPESVANHMLESALDELSYRLGMDPIELRMRNWSDVNQETGVRHGSNHLRECYQRGAEMFGWSRRAAQPGSMRSPDGELIGWGMATASHVTGGVPGSAASVAIGPEGTADIRCGTVDIGTGTYTALTQLGAEVLGMPLHAVTFALGDSAYPEAVFSAVSATVPSAGGAVVRAATSVRDEIIRIAVTQEGNPLHGLAPDQIGAGDGHLFDTRAPARRVSHRDVIRAHGRPVEATSSPVPTELGYSFGATFVEVRVAPRTGRVRVTRMVGVFDPGRVINWQTVRSQAIGGAIWGIGIALTEHALVDPHLGRVVTPNLSSYLIPANADVPDVEVDFIDRPDPAFSALGARGFGETPSTGFSAAIGNAVHHAIGRRISALPITQDKVIAALVR